MIGTAMLPLNLLRVIPVDRSGRPDAPEEPGPAVLSGEDGREAALAALRYSRAAVWVGPAGSPAYREFIDEIGRARSGEG